MKLRIIRWLPWSIWLITLQLMAAALGLWWLRGAHDWLQENIVFAPVNLAYATVGALIASRRPQNPIGWIFGIATAITAFGDVAQAYASCPVDVSCMALPAGAVVAWFGAWTRILGGNLSFIALLLLPNGRLLSRRWRPVLWLTVVAIIVQVGLVAVQPGPFWFAPMIRNPLGIESAADTLATITRNVDRTIGLLVALAAISLIVRFLRSSGVERQQLKWIAYAAALPIGFVGYGLVSTLLQIPMPQVVGDWVFFAVVLSFPLAVGIAILKHRLYDIDLLINRTLVYTLLTLWLTVTYVGSVVVLQAVLRPLIGRETQLAIVASTLAIAALFQPLRRRIQSVIDRRFYRRKYDAQTTLQAFGAQLRAETDLEHLSAELIDVVQQTMQPAHVSLWLQPSKEQAQP